MIVQALHEIQHRHGYLPRPELVLLADRIDTPLFRIEEVASFFPHFRKTPPPEIEIRVCRDMACRLHGSHKVTQELISATKDKPNWKVCEVSCLGRCDRAPAAFVAKNPQGENGHAANNGHDRHEPHEFLIVASDSKRLKDVAAALAAGQHPTVDTDAALDPAAHEKWQIDPYKDGPEQRYANVRRFLALNKDEEREQFRKDTLKALETGNLLGMGGAGGRAYKKWSEVRGAYGDRKYVVCNGDESEPGTFKDRELFLRTPHLIVEGMVLGAIVTGAQRGFVYIRHEYPEQIAAVRDEIKRAVAQGVCGPAVGFDLEVFVSPGGYICGEQTALIEAIQDKRAEPRNRPPELQTNGLWDKPTLLNNVETFAWVPAIAGRDQGQWFASAAVQVAVPGWLDRGGKPNTFKGRRFFSVSGDLSKPGAHEVPIGITIGELIDDYCGGMSGGQKLKAAALSGPSGGFMPAMLAASSLPKFIQEAYPGQKLVPLRDMRLDIALFRELRMMMGAGIVFYGDRADMVEQAYVSSVFYAEESCGKCVPCRIGSRKIVDAVSKLYHGQMTKAEVEALCEPDGPIGLLSQIMSVTAICGLGQVASNPLSTLLKHFPEDVAKYAIK
jgi:NADH:ubiquinone oxidoreductase subunit F (NADH-binding)